MDATKFVSANFIPVKKQGATNADSPAADVEQLAVQNAVIKGQITGFAMDSGGAGYTSNPTVTIETEHSRKVLHLYRWCTSY